MFEMIFTSGVFKGFTIAEFNRAQAAIFVLSFLLGYCVFQKNGEKPYSDSWFLHSVALPFIPVLIVSFAFLLYDAPVKIINKSTGSAIEAKNMEDGRKILDFVQEKEQIASLEEATKILYR